MLISFIGLALYFGYGTAATGDSWRYPILALGIATATVAILHALNIYQVQHFQAGFLRIPASVTLLVRSLHIGAKPVSRRTTGRCFVPNMARRILFCRNCCPYLRTICGARSVGQIGERRAVATTHDNEDEAPHCIAAVDFCCSSSSICAASSRSASAAVPCGEHKKVWLGSVVWCPGGRCPADRANASPEIAAGEVAHL